MIRDIPAPIRRQLRSEVGYLCPFPKCEDPYLTYHHFDPPWREGLIHDAKGMIALCINHHKRADVGTYTKDTLRQLKDSKNRLPVKGDFFDWKREKSIFLAGSTIQLNCDGLVRMNGQKIVWFEHDESGNDFSLSFDFYDENGNILCSMRKNSWMYMNEGGDLDCATSGHRIRISEGFRKSFFEIKFRNLGAIRHNVFKELVERNIPTDLIDGETLVVTIEANFIWPERLRITNTTIEVNNVTISGGMMKHSGYLIDI